MPRLTYVLNAEMVNRPLDCSMYKLDETYDPVLLADIQSRTDCTSIRPFTYAVTMKTFRSNRPLLYVCFENPQSNSALYHLWLPSYYRKYERK